MPKIKAVQFVINPAGNIVVLDDRGRFWLKDSNGNWSVMAELPERPDDDPKPQISF